MTEYELPPQTQLQQASARRVSGEELETFGKSAAALFHQGDVDNLNDAVVKTIKKEALSPEQVKRVVEFTNTHAFIDEFRKEGEATKYVHFEHGPAHPAEVIKDLNDGGGGTVFDTGNFDYSHEPAVVKKGSAQGLYAGNLRSMEKTAADPSMGPAPPPPGAEEMQLEAIRSALGEPRFTPQDVAALHRALISQQTPLPVEAQKQAEADAVLAEAFKTEHISIPYANPLQDVEQVQDKLATARDAATAKMSELEVALLDINSDLYHQVKQAALAEVPLGHVLQAWHEVFHPDEALVKAAFSLIGPRLYAEGIFNADQLGESMQKTAGSMMLNEEHPIIKTFGAYTEAITKLAELRAAKNELESGLEKVQTFRKMATQHMELAQ